MKSSRCFTFFGGCVPASAEDEKLAYHTGYQLGSQGFALRHGGHRGLMEEVARGASDAGAPVIAITLANTEWDPFNPYITESTYHPDMGTRMMHFFGDTDLIIAMGGGTGTLHELTAALWYAGNIRPVPVWLMGAKALRLLDFLLAERWLYESSKRPLGFMQRIPDLEALDAVLAGLTFTTEAI